MSRQSYQIGVLGTGFAGTITGLILKQMGYEVVLVDRSRHPRFAIGESSTPIADRILAKLCDQYDLPELRPLTAYGSARQQSEHYRVGPKRGFSYFSHHSQPNHSKDPQTVSHSFDPGDREQQLLVAASQCEELSDTHWHRATVDHFIAQCAVRRGLDLLEDVDLRSIELETSSAWRLRGTHDDEELDLRVHFLIDATGRRSPLASSLHLPEETDQLRTQSGAVYGHFKDLDRSDTWFRHANTSDEHPFPCDDAAVHQITTTGWMWQLRFDNQITSCGWGLPRQYMPRPEEDLTIWWQKRIEEFPSLRQQFSDASVVAPEGGLQHVPRLQYLRKVISGRGWAMLPSSAGFIDPLHSSGIAHAMANIERLTALFPGAGALPSEACLHQYGKNMKHEFLWIDLLVSACYEALFDFRLFQRVCMWYFLAVIHYERQRLSGSQSPPAFLSANCQDLQTVIRKHLTDLPRREDGPLSRHQINRLNSDYREAMAPFNHADLLSTANHPFYQHTAAPGK